MEGGELAIQLESETDVIYDFRILPLPLVINVQLTLKGLD